MKKFYTTITAAIFYTSLNIFNPFSYAVMPSPPPPDPALINRFGKTQQQEQVQQQKQLTVEELLNTPTTQLTPQQYEQILRIRQAEQASNLIQLQKQALVVDSQLKLLMGQAAKQDLQLKTLVLEKERLALQRFYWDNNDILLYENRIIKLDDIIIKQPIDSLVAKLYQLDSKNHEPIVLLIDSGGGDMNSGYRLISTMHSLKSPVYTVCLGFAGSMASAVFASGEQGHRYIFPDSKVHIHEPLRYTQQGVESATQIIRTGEEVAKSRAYFMGVYSNATGKSVKEIEEDLLRLGNLILLTPEEALNYGPKGLADHIVTKENNPIKIKIPVQRAPAQQTTK